MADLPEDWFVEHDGQRLILDPEKVQEAIGRQDVAIRACNNKISELELWNRDYREQIAFWKAKAEGSGSAGQPLP